MSGNTTDRLKTAYDVETAIEMATVTLRPIGHCETALDGWRKRSGSHAPLPEPDMLTPAELLESRRKSSLGAVEKLVTKHTRPAKVSTFENPFQLTITRPGCEFSGSVYPGPASAPPPSQDTITEAVLKQWHQHGHAMGPSADADGAVDFFNLRPASWNSRSIAASEITVSQNLAQKIQAQWSATFFPRRVVAVPWKIIVSGPGAYIERYREPPIPNLVGSCIVGIADFTGLEDGEGEDGAQEEAVGWRLNDGALTVEGSEEGMRSKPGRMISFYSDMAIAIAPVDVGFRAVLMYHVFDAEVMADAAAGIPRSPLINPPALEEDLKAITTLLADVPKPFGLFLAHEYSLDSTRFVGVDSVLAHAAREMKGAEVYVIPVASRFVAHAIIDMDEARTTMELAKAPVVPLTRVCVEALLERAEAAAQQSGVDGDGEDEDIGEVMVIGDLVPDDSELWLKRVKDVPFYRLRTGEIGYDMSQAENMQCPTTRPDEGLATEPPPVSAAYLLYAVIVLPDEK